VDIKAVSEFPGHASTTFALETYTRLMPSAPNRARAALAASRAHREPPPDGT
jgi:hypothetical protein